MYMCVYMRSSSIICKCMYMYMHRQYTHDVYEAMRIVVSIVISQNYVTCIMKLIEFPICDLFCFCKCRVHPVGLLKIAAAPSVN